MNVDGRRETVVDSYEKGVFMVAMWKAKGRVCIARGECDRARTYHTMERAGRTLLYNMFGKSIMIVKRDIKRMADEMQEQVEAMM